MRQPPPRPRRWLDPTEVLPRPRPPQEDPAAPPALPRPRRPVAAERPRSPAPARRPARGLFAETLAGWRAWRRRLPPHVPLLCSFLLALAMVVGHVSEDDGDEPVEQSDSGASRLAGFMRPLAPGERPPQFVLFSFDGAGSHEHWHRVMALAEESEAHVTGFLSGTYLLDDSRRKEYRGPGHDPGDSSIGFGGTPQEVATLIDDLNTAVARGHEIGTHYNGHFCAGAEPSGQTWSQAMWDDELRQFFAFVEGARAQGLALDPATIKGGRTPCLEGDWAQANPAMAAHGLTYDSSRTSDGIAWPSDEGGIREYWMPEVRVPALGRKVILMDYNLWYALNGARSQPERAAEFAEVALGAYRAAYRAAFDGNRAPLVVGNHFNEWSGGAFSAAVEEFLGEVCTRPETVCATYSEVDRWMALQDPAVLDQYRRMPNAQVPSSD